MSTTMANYHPVILDVLTKATSQNPELIKLAEQQLKCLEVEAGYYTMLMAVVLDRSVDVNIRWLASVCLKNGIDRYWRKTAPNAIPIEERAGLKQKFLLCFDEPVNIVSTQIAVIISKVARMDFPSDWPELFPTIVSVIQRPEHLHQQRGLLVLHHVVKTLASKRLVGDQQVFQQLTASLFSSIMHLWANYSNAFLQEAKNIHSNHKLLLEKCLYCLKVLRKFVIYGFKQPSKEPDAVTFISIIFQQFKPFIEYRKCILNHEGLGETCEKYLVLLVKVLWGVLEQHASSFVQFIQPTLECAVTFCFTEEYKDALFERLTVGLLNLIKAILTSEDFRPGKLKMDSKNPELYEADAIRKQFFTEPIINEMIHQLVSRYFLLTESEIRTWEENPEEFAIDERGESWKFNLRPCTEVLFLSLFRDYYTIIAPVVLRMVKGVQDLTSTDFATILKKEAVFNCVGLSSYNLYDEINFDSWFTDVLIPELRINGTNYYIVRRRVVWLIGKCIELKISSKLRLLFYEVALQVLDHKENLLVRLSAANALKSAVDNLEFEVEQFMPFLEGIFAQLFQLLKDVKECDLKMSVLHVMSFLIERVGKNVQLHVNSLISYLFELWESCGDHMMLRCAIVTCFNELVHSLGAGSESLHSLLIPMIAFSTDVRLPGHVYLLEDALQLWQSALENATTCSPELLDVAKNIIPLLECGSETVFNCVDILDAYILLSPKEYLQTYGEDLVRTFMHIISDLVPDAGTYLMRVVEHALVVFPMEGTALFKPVLAVALSLVLESDVSYQLQDSPEYPIGSAVQLSLLSRVVLHNKNCFGALLQERAYETKQEVDKVFANLLDTWLVKMPFVPTVEHKKLLGLALLCLLTTDSSVVQDRICGILLAVVEVLNDVSGEHKICNDILVINNENENDLRDEEEDVFDSYTEHEKRQTPFRLRDPVYTVVLKDYLKSQMTALEQSVGRVKFEDLMSTVDVETMQQLRDYLLN